MYLRKNIISIIENKQIWQQVSTYSSSTKNRNVEAVRNVEDVGKSIASKGFLRAHKPYNPADNVVARVHAICETLKISNANGYKLKSLEEKFNVLDACFKDFQHSVPNSYLHELETIGDVVKFYETPVNTTTPYDALKNVELPENLHIQHEYLRFHPDTDTKFDGQTAFPKSSTLVTGLKYRGKYKGHEAKRSWP